MVSDHEKYSHEYSKLGIPVWKPYENTEQKFLKKQFGSFKVTCFDLFHDNVENRGFLIEVDNQTILYMTDFEYCKYVFAPKIRINHMLIEMNYDKNMVHMESANAEHIFRGHCEKETALGFIVSNITDALRNVILCHLSGLNAQYDTFIADTQKVAKNANINVAERGLKLDLEIEPF